MGWIRRKCKVIVVFFVVSALRIERLQVRLAQVSRINRHNLGVVDLAEQLGVQSLCELSVRLR